MKKILINIISGQLLPNYVATKHVNPDLCISLYTKDSKKLLKSFEDYFNNQMKFHDIEIDAYDYIKIYNTIKNTLNEYKNNEIISNFTGGTKIMSLALFNAAKEENIKNIYINTEGNEIIEFTEEINTFPIQIKTTIKEIFKLNGQEIEIQPAQLDDKYLDTYNFLKDYHLVFERYINKFRTKFMKNIQIEPASKGSFAGTFIKYENGFSKVKFVFNGEPLYEKEEKGAELITFISGFWFEYYCLKVLENLNFFDELVMNVKLKVQNNNNSNINKKKVKNTATINEIDIIGLKGIYPYIFECKSGNFSAANIDKLFGLKDSLTRYSNLYVITYYRFKSSNPQNPPAMQKAREKNIEIITYEDLENGKVDFNKRTNMK